MSITNNSFSTLSHAPAGGYVTSHTFTHNLGSGINRVFLVSISNYGSSVSDVTYNEIPLTKLVDNGSTVYNTSLWILYESELPALGNYNVIVYFTTSALQAYGSAITMGDVQQDTPEVQSQFSSVGEGATYQNLVFSNAEADDVIAAAECIYSPAIPYDYAAAFDNFYAEYGVGWGGSYSPPSAIVWTIGDIHQMLTATEKSVEMTYTSQGTSYISDSAALFVYKPQRKRSFFWL
jgi:hypothetical protein